MGGYFSEQIVKLDLEGIVCKRKSSPYRATEESEVGPGHEESRYLRTKEFADYSDLICSHIASENGNGRGRGYRPSGPPGGWARCPSAGSSEAGRNGWRSIQGTVGHFLSRHSGRPMIIRSWGADGCSMYVPNSRSHQEKMLPKLDWLSTNTSE